MARNEIVTILDYQNQITELKKRLQPFVDAEPNNPVVFELRLEIAYLEGKLAANLELAEFINS